MDVSLVLGPLTIVISLYGVVGERDGWVSCSGTTHHCLLTVWCCGEREGWKSCFGATHHCYLTVWCCGEREGWKSCSWTTHHCHLTVWCCGEREMDVSLVLGPLTIVI